MTKDTETGSRLLSRGHSCDGCDNDYTLSGIRVNGGSAYGIMEERKNCIEENECGSEEKVYCLAGLVFLCAVL